MRSRNVEVLRGLSSGISISAFCLRRLFQKKRISGTYSKTTKNNILHETSPRVKFKGVVLAHFFVLLFFPDEVEIRLFPQILRISSSEVSQRSTMLCFIGRRHNKTQPNSKTCEISSCTKKEHKQNRRITTIRKQNKLSPGLHCKYHHLYMESIALLLYWKNSSNIEKKGFKSLVRYT